MRLVVETADWGPVFNIVEGGLDKFEVTEGPASVNEADIFMMSAFPNPYSDKVRINFSSAAVNDRSVLQVTDVTGKLVLEERLNPVAGYIETGSTLGAGIYFARIIGDNGSSATIKINKVR